MANRIITINITAMEEDAQDFLADFVVDVEFSPGTKVNVPLLVLKLSRHVQELLERNCDGDNTPFFKDGKFIDTTVSS